MSKKLTKIVSLAVVCFCRVSALAGSPAHEQAEALRQQKERAKRSLSNLESQVADLISKNDVLAPQMKNTIIEALLNGNQIFLETLLQKDCLVAAIGTGAVGGSALREDILNCEINAIRSREAQLRTNYGL